METPIDEYYFYACEYMAKTELYDRSLTYCRSPWDKTEAFLDNPRVKKISNEYAAQLRRYYSEICGGTWQFIHNEIHKHTKYTAQMWIDEYDRLKEVLKDENDDNWNCSSNNDSICHTLYCSLFESQTLSR